MLYQEIDMNIDPSWTCQRWIELGGELASNAILSR